MILLPDRGARACLALGAGGASDAEVSRRAMGLFLLGPVLGVGVGYVAITLLDRVRSRVGVRRDYESLYALGVAFTAFAAAESVGGSGFLAAFAAGLVVAAMDVELCDCFLDYGEASAEMFLLLTFVAFGASVIWTGFQVADGLTLAFAVLALGLRTAVLIPVLRLGGRRAAEPAADRVARAARPEHAAAGPAAGVRGGRGIRAPVPDHLPRGPAVGGGARRRHRDFSPPRAIGAGPGARAPAGGAGRRSRSGAPRAKRRSFRRRSPSRSFATCRSAGSR